MVSINFDKKCLFLHLPKNAGTTIQIIISELFDFIPYNSLSTEYKKYVYSYNMSLPQYYRQEKILNSINLTVEEIDSYDKITFCRNPYTRFISGWKYMLQNNCISIESLQELIEKKDLLSTLVYNHIFSTQCYHIDNWNFKYIGRFENLIPDLKAIMLDIFKEINMSSNINQIKDIHHNKTNNYGSILQYYTIDILLFVNSNFKCDFERFNYPIANSLEELELLINSLSL